MAPIAGVGTDLVEVSRFRTFVEQEREAILERLFTPGERQYALARRDPAPHLAARFAAKEAFLKALGLGLRQGISWQDMDIVRNDLGRPEMLLGGQAGEIFSQRGLDALHLSYSHDGNYAIATVILETA